MWGRREEGGGGRKVIGHVKTGKCSENDPSCQEKEESETLLYANAIQWTFVMAWISPSEDLSEREKKTTFEWEREREREREREKR